MKPVSFGATTAASAAARGTAAATKAAGAAGAAPPPPPPRRPAGAGTQVAGKTAPKTPVEEQVSEAPVGPPPPPAETTEELRAQQKAVREGNPVPQFLAEKGRPTSKLARVAGDVAEVAGWTAALGPFAGPLVGSAVDRMNKGDRRTTAQTVADIARMPLVGSMIEDVVGSDRYSRAKAAVSEYVPDVVRSAASYVPPILAGPFGLTAPATAVAFAAGGDAEKRNIAGREVVVYPKYAEMRARDTGPARIARMAREAQTPAIFETRRDALRQAFGQAKKDYKSAVEQADTKFQNKKLSPAAIEDSALEARERLQKVVDLREALRELKEPEGNLVIK
jgi:hypothetical protein